MRLTCTSSHGQRECFASRTKVLTTCCIYEIRRQRCDGGDSILWSDKVTHKWTYKTSIPTFALSASSYLSDCPHLSSLGGSPNSVFLRVSSPRSLLEPVNSSHILHACAYFRHSSVVDQVGGIASVNERVGRATTDERKESKDNEHGEYHM